MWQRPSIRSVNLLVARAILIVALIGTSMASVRAARATRTIHILNDSAFHAPGFAAVSKITSKRYGVGLKVNLYLSNHGAFESTVNLGLASPHPPALFEWWFGYRLQQLASTKKLVDITPLWNAAIKQGAYTREQMRFFSVGGKAFGVPLLLNYWVMFYNMHVFDRYHLKPPQTWSQFQRVAATLKSMGVTPFGLATADCVWCGFIWFEELLVRSNPTLYEQLLAGKARYTSPGVVRIMQIWKSMIDKGYFSNPGITTTGLIQDFARGDAAMMLYGDWQGPILTQQARLQPGRDYGVFVVPGMTRAGDRPLIVEARPLLLGKGSVQANDALKVAGVLMSTEGQTRWAKALHVNPVNLHVASSVRPSYLVKLSRAVGQGKYTLYPRYWEGTAPQLSEAVSSLLDQFTVHPATYRQTLAQAQSLADQYLGHS
jgi:ABC-type glycerol-3-phosphate transport system substrate-binding protein